MVSKFKPKLNSKFILNGSKTIKIMKGSKNRGGLTQVKAICFLDIKKQEISIYYDSKEIQAIEYSMVSGFGVSSEHRIDILNAKSIGKEHFNVFLTERFIEKTVSFWDPVKKFRRSHQKCSMKNTILKNSTIITGKHLGWRLFSPVMEFPQLC